VQKGARAYLGASFVGQGAALVRFVILSRLLGPEQLGLAALLIVTSQFFELVTDTATDRFMIQDADGDSPVLQRVVQAGMVLRGLLIAAGLAVASRMMGTIYDAPELAPALIGMGLTPLIAGFVNIDMYRAQRQGDFRATSLATIISEIAGLVGTATAAWFLRDHSAIVYGLAARASALVAVSQITAVRPYRWGYSKPEARRFLTFAIPTFVSGLLFFFGSQGDRLLIGKLGKAELGRYSAIQLLIFSPTAALSKFFTQIHLPGLVAQRDEPIGFGKVIDRFAGRTLLLSIALACGFAVVGPFVAPLLYGRAFHQPPMIFALLAVMQTTRMLRIWPVTIALSLGRTSLAAIDNAVRLIGLPVALLALKLYANINGILGGLILGEWLALLVTFVLVYRAAGVPYGGGGRRIALFTATSVLTILFAAAVEGHFYWLAAPALVAGVASVAAVALTERPVVGETLALSRRTLSFAMKRFRPAS
jgi:lipopolysaccharide exporter